eukprot:GEMP01041516.1.p1 GENE.GEMP01041516.1~~GEMP01041516.1.p1  ORF type:complete len:250 (+),score=28.54 GEMP01041516.1:31-750(+)
MGDVATTDITWAVTSLSLYPQREISITLMTNAISCQQSAIINEIIEADASAAYPTDFLVVDAKNIHELPLQKCIREGGCLVLLSDGMLSTEDLDSFNNHLQKHNFEIVDEREEIRLRPDGLFITAYRRGRDCANVDCDAYLEKVEPQKGINCACGKISRYACAAIVDEGCTKHLCHECFVANRFTVRRNWNGVQDYGYGYLDMKEGDIIHRQIKLDDGWTKGFLESENVAKWFPPQFVQ